MEEVNIAEWLDDTPYNYGYGSGSASGYGDGYGSGDGYGYGDGDGYGYGDGSGYGSGYGDGYGSGYGDGDGLKKYSQQDVYIVDKMQTLICKIKGNYAKGYILNSDLTLQECYIAKGQGFYAHGKTLKEAYQALQDKILENMDIEEKIERVCEEYEKDVKYPNQRFYELHHILTGSCVMGRDRFVKEHDIDLDGEMTVDEFIELTINDYGSSIIKMLKEKWNGEEE